MTLAVVTDPRMLDHRSGVLHPERPERLEAALKGLEIWHDAVLSLEPEPVADADVVAVHDQALFGRLVDVDAAGGGRVDADTSMSAGSMEACRLAAGAGLTAVQALVDGRADSAFCAVRPPGHHATRSNSMGFCLVNNVAVTARHLTSDGSRVAIIDIDAHHGNGTQDVFETDPSVLFISAHQYPWYPGSGRLDERGSGEGFGTTINVPLPSGAAGDTYRAAVDDVVVPAVERFRPDWVLVSAGFDAHRADPLSQLGLSAGDFADLIARIVSVAPKRRLVAFLEGGYDLDALQASTQAMAGAMLETSSPTEAATSEGPGRDVVAAAAALVDDVSAG